jgi:hypothetical protein
MNVRWARVVVAVAVAFPLVGLVSARVADAAEVAVGGTLSSANLGGSSDQIRCRGQYTGSGGSTNILHACHVPSIGTKTPGGPYTSGPALDGGQRFVMSPHSVGGVPYAVRCTGGTSEYYVGPITTPYGVLGDLQVAAVTTGANCSGVYLGLRSTAVETYGGTGDSGNLFVTGGALLSGGSAVIHKMQWSGSVGALSIILPTDWYPGGSGPEAPWCWSPETELWGPDELAPAAGSGGPSEVVRPGGSVSVSAPWPADEGVVSARWVGATNWTELDDSPLTGNQTGSLQLSPFSAVNVSVTRVEFRCEALYEGGSTFLYSYWHLDQGVPLFGWTPFHATNLKRPCQGVQINVYMDEEELFGNSVLADGDTAEVRVTFTYATNTARLTYRWKTLPTTSIDPATGEELDIPEVVTGTLVSASFAADVLYQFYLGPFLYVMPSNGLSITCADNFGALQVWDNGPIPGGGEVVGGSGLPEFGGGDGEGCFESSGWSLDSPSSWVAGGVKMAGCYASALVVPDPDEFAERWETFEGLREEPGPLQWADEGISFVGSLDVNVVSWSDGGPACVDVLDTEVCPREWDDPSLVPAWVVGALLFGLWSLVVFAIWKFF